MTAQQAEGDTLLGALRSAQHEAWSGRVSVAVDGRELGSVVFRAGRVAWAVCVEEPEDLGTFLWRLGRVTREELLLVRQRYAQHQGNKKLGTLLEEAGILPRPVLQRCLLLHTRRAVSRLLRYDGARVSSERTALQVDEEMTFPLSEVAPLAGEDDGARFEREGSSAARWSGWSEENGALLEFSAMAGYLASCVLSRDGEVIAAHAGRDVDPATLGMFVISVLELSDRTAAPAGLGTVGAACFECARGTLVAQWLDPSRSHVALLLVEAGANTGMARYRLASAAPSLSEWVRSRQRSTRADTRTARSPEVAGPMS